MRLPVVDDIASSVFLLKLVLTRIGDNEVAAAGNGVEALLQVLDQTAFDCVITDYEMPEMNGLELIQTARGRGITSPIIVSTTDEKYAASCLTAGANAFLPKPVDAEVLQTMLAKVCGVPA